MCKLHDYFCQLAALHSSFLHTLGEHWSSLETLDTAIHQQQEYAIAQLTQMQRPLPAPSTPTRGVGLNTIGLLSDRLTILVIKEWSLSHHHNDQGSAKDLYESCTLDIIDALTQALPAKGTLNKKLSIHQPTIHVNSWEEVFYALFATNVLIWNAQELFYCQTDEVSIEQLQKHMQWVPKLNLQRDELMQQCENFYWQRLVEQNLDP